MNIKKQIGSRIRQVRARLQMTQAQFAEKLGSSKSTISGYELGDTYPSVEVALLVTKLGDVSTDWLLKGKEGDGVDMPQGLTPEEEKLVCAFRQMNTTDQNVLLRIAEVMGEEK